MPTGTSHGYNTRKAREHPSFKSVTPTELESGGNGFSGANKEVQGTPVPCIDSLEIIKVATFHYCL